MIDYSPFWEMLASRNISTYDLEYSYNFNPAEISRLKHNHNYTLLSIERYCKLFHCDLTDIVTFTDLDK